MEAEIDKVEQDRQRENDRRDLQAQEDMAYWAFWMMIGTFATVLLTLAALIAIIKTLRHTGRAADASEAMVRHAASSTTAALSAVSVTREIGEAETAAHVAINNVVRNNTVFQFTIENSGPTAAYEVKVHTEIEDEVRYHGFGIIDPRANAPGVVALQLTPKLDAWLRFHVSYQTRYGERVFRGCAFYQGQTMKNGWTAYNIVPDTSYEYRERMDDDT